MHGRALWSLYPTKGPNEWDQTKGATLRRVEYCRYGDIVCNQSPGIAHLIYASPGSQETA
ncbi:hypothetical protein U2A4042120004 [Corynebacterium striatum]|nr:hypothetical protein U2A4042120004 [Corynebacterium striatum]